MAVEVSTIGVIGSLAIGAAGLLFGMYQHADKKKSKKIRLKTTVSNGMLTYNDGSLSDAMIFLTIANIGDKPAIINSPSINIKRKGGGTLLTRFGYYQSFPHELKPGESTVAWHEIRPIARSLKDEGMSGKVPLECSFITQVGDVFKAKKPYKLDVDDWAKNDG